MSRSHNLELAIGVNPYTFWLPERTRLFEAFRVRQPAKEALGALAQADDLAPTALG